ncbi:MAG: DUF1573 domain-containing protein, partial [Ferruginibacter sp.]|nr:DUF1573 domain-containing protein [Ferruginibacter sp.]
MSDFVVMKKILLILFICMLNKTLFAQKDGSNSTNTPSTVLLKVKEDTFDFGKIPQGRPVHHQFEVSNNGAGLLKLTNVQASCGCTTPEWERDKEIGPGEKTTIKVGYNAASEGQFAKTITITYNDNQTKVVTIKGEV